MPGASPARPCDPLSCERATPLPQPASRAPRPAPRLHAQPAGRSAPRMLHPPRLCARSAPVLRPPLDGLGAGRGRGAGRGGPRGRAGGGARDSDRGGGAQRGREAGPWRQAGPGGARAGLGRAGARVQRDEPARKEVTGRSLGPEHPLAAMWGVSSPAPNPSGSSLPAPAPPERASPQLLLAARGVQAPRPGQGPGRRNRSSPEYIPEEVSRRPQESGPQALSPVEASRRRAIETKTFYRQGTMDGGRGSWAPPAQSRGRISRVVVAQPASWPRRAQALDNSPPTPASLPTPHHHHFQQLPGKDGPVPHEASGGPSHELTPAPPEGSCPHFTKGWRAPGGALRRSAPPGPPLPPHPTPTHTPLPTGDPAAPHQRIFSLPPPSYVHPVSIALGRCTWPRSPLLPWGSCA